MSIPAAWRFIQLVRRDAALRDHVVGLGPDPDLQALVVMGAERGLSFTLEDLRAAHRFDWEARWRHGEDRSSSPSTE